MKNFNLIFSTLLLLMVNSVSYAQPVLQWQKNYGGAGIDSAYSIQQTSDGGFIVAGQSTSTGGDITGNHGGIDYWIVKLNAAGIIIWQKNFGGSGNDIARSIQQTTDGGYIVAGNSNSFDGDVTDHGRSYTSGIGIGSTYSGPPVYEPWIIKLDVAGTIIWKKSLHKEFVFASGHYHEFFDHYVNTIIQTSDGGYLAGGNTELLPDEPDAGLISTMLVKLTAAGDVTWSKTNFHGDRMDIASIVQAGSGYAVAGSGRSFGSHGGIDAFVFKTDLAGNWLWGFEYGGSNDDKAYSIRKTMDGGFIVAGVAGSSDGDLTAAGNHGGNDYFLLKLNSSGGISWSKCYGGTGSDIARSVQQTGDGGYVIAGSSGSRNGQVTDHHPGGWAGQLDYWITKTDNAGNFTWGRIYGGSADDAAWSLEKNSDGSLIVAGTSLSTDAGFLNKGYSDYWVLKLNVCGVVYPPISFNQGFCSGAYARVSNLVAFGANLRWYNTPAGITPLAPSTLLATGNYYVTLTTSSGCESSRRTVLVTINPTPAMPAGPATQYFTLCKTYYVANLLATGSNLKWYNVAAGGSPLPPSTILSYGYYYVSQTSAEGCESARKAVYVYQFPCFILYQKSFVNRLNEEKEIKPADAQLYPNPAGTGKVTVLIKTPGVYDNAIIQVLDLNGRILQQENAANSKGLIEKTIDVSQLPSAVYMVKYITGKLSGNLKLVISR